MYFRMFAFASAMLMAVSARAGETALSDPVPTMDAPRQILLQLTSDDEARINGVLNNVAALSKFYGMDNVNLAVVTYGSGVKALLANGSPVKERISSLQHYGVEFVACGNTLARMKIPEDQVLPDVKVAAAGIAEIVERRVKGWHYIVPTP